MHPTTLLLLPTIMEQYIFHYMLSDIAPVRDLHNECHGRYSHSERNRRYDRTGPGMMKPALAEPTADIGQTYLEILHGEPIRAVEVYCIQNYRKQEIRKSCTGAEKQRVMP